MSVQVQYDPETTGPRHFVAAVDDIGFAASVTDSNRWVTNVNKRPLLVFAPCLLGTLLRSVLGHVVPYAH